MAAKLLKISTPLRTILMEKISDTGLTSLEQEAMAKYEQLHNELFALTSMWRKAEADVRGLRRPQERIIKELQALKEETEGYRSILREVPVSEDTLLLSSQTLTAYGEDMQYFFDVYQASVQAFHDDYKMIIAENDKLLKLYEDFDANYYQKINLNFDNSSINLIRLDEDFNEFNIMMDEVSDLIRKTTDDYKAVSAEYEKIVHEMDIVLKSIDHFSQEVTGLRAGGMNRPEELN